MCLLGSAEELCCETQPLTAGPLVDGPALPGKPEANTQFQTVLVYSHGGTVV